MSKKQIRPPRDEFSICLAVASSVESESSTTAFMMPVFEFDGKGLAEFDGYGIANFDGPLMVISSTEIGFSSLFTMKQSRTAES